MDILGHQEPDGPSDRDEPGPVASLVDRLGRLPDVVRERVSSVGTRCRALRHRLRLALRDATGTSAADGTGEAAKCPDMDGFPDREYLLTYPAREITGVNTPDVVCIETDRGLRLSVPENPDATLTSDVWTHVEP